MGKLIKIATKNILPSQNFIKDDTIEFILKCLNRNEEDKLPPAPIIRVKPESDKYIAIDGHNLLAVCDMLGKDCEVYLAESIYDKLLGNTDSIIERNQMLEEKYDQVLQSTKTLKRKGVGSFTDLRNKYPYLKSLTKAKKHFNLN